MKSILPFSLWCVAMAGQAESGRRRRDCLPSCVALLIALSLLPAPALAQRVRVNPTGVNVNVNGSTTVFLTFGGVNVFRPAEAVWCGELIPATPDIGLRCDPATIFGSLPARFDLSTQSGSAGLTDIMSIPPSVSRRAYQAAQSGTVGSFFYVRRFISLQGGPDEFVAVTCRLTEGGARSPLALTEVKLSFAVEAPILFVKPGDRMPAIKAEIAYNGTGRLKGRWEAVLPGEELPEAKDLLTEATLPVEQRPTQRRYTQLGRFNHFLPPAGKTVLPGPDISRIPSQIQGPYLILLRVEASDDKEGDSNLSAAGAGAGVVHSGAVAGFPLPVLRYFVGGLPTAVQAKGRLAPLTPEDQAVVPTGTKVNLVWTETEAAALLRVEVEDGLNQPLLSALLRPGMGIYALPSWIAEKAAGAPIRWRVVALDAGGAVTEEGVWRSLKWGESRP